MENRPTTGMFLRFLLLILTIVNQTMLAPANHHSGNQHVARRIDLQSAISIRKNFTCKEPQQRAYNLRDLMQHLPSERTRQPVYIVLKRCDSYSGCCRSADLSCIPVESSIYYEDIEIEMSSLAMTTKRKADHRWIRVKQHGECICKIVDANQTDTEPPVIQIL
ncbi:uncharacterized protein LOC116840621 [Odontomachus brunneus]|uniref:uncharacterized protein LOC116840621 n=1 Tax=Odontomachus brunneus TaxID=486640 RepID=UPI0013F2324C|nr:uncharacterized protein LOC116840621 [Odontomachus brunneus]